MKLKSIASWLIGYEIFTWFLIWMNLRTPWVDPFDGSKQPTKNQVILMTHIYSLAFVLVFIVFAEIFKRVWRASNRRR